MMGFSEVSFANYGAYEACVCTVVTDGTVATG